MGFLNSSASSHLLENILYLWNKGRIGISFGWKSEFKPRLQGYLLLPFYEQYTEPPLPERKRCCIHIKLTEDKQGLRELDQWL